MRVAVAMMLALLSGIGVAAAPGNDLDQGIPQQDNSGRLPDGGVRLGQTWPDDAGTTAIPPYAAVHYGLGAGDDWRAANGTIYRIDPQTRSVTAFVALVTGDDFTIGERAPAGYDIYNVPVAYRDRWKDGPDVLYRYADGRVYRIDPRTRRVDDAIDIPAIPLS